MQVFICAFGGFYVAIPMSSVASLTDITDQRRGIEEAAQRGAVTRGEENQETYVSLPLLFNLPHEKLRHGIVLKNHPGDHADENKIILLSTEVVNTGEIPDEKMHPIPRVLNDTRFAAMFSRVQCAAETTRDLGLVILLDTERLVRYARQEAA